MARPTRLRQQRRRRSINIVSNVLQLTLAAASAQAAQPSYNQSGSPGQFKIVGDAGVSAQQIFLGTSNKVTFRLTHLQLTPPQTLNRHYLLHRRKDLRDRQDREQPGPSREPKPSSMGYRVRYQ